MSVITNSNLLCTVALAALQEVTDPEIGLDVVDLGLIYQIDFDEAKRTLYCTMTLTSKFCPMGESITHAVGKVLQRVFPDYLPVLNLTFDPSWSHERISAEGRAFLDK